MTVAQALGRSADCGARLGACFRADAPLLLRVVFWRTVLPVLKRTVSLQTLVRWMCPRQISRPRRDESCRRARLQTIRYFVSHAGRLAISENCLERSLMLYRFLGEVDANPRLVMGVRRDGGTTDGHVWIDIEGEPLLDSTTTRYSPVLVFEAGGAVLPVR